MPPHFRLDAAIVGLFEVSKVGSLNATWDEIDAIVGDFGGGCQECEEVAPNDHVPFRFLCAQFN